MTISYAARVAGVAGSGQDRVRVVERDGGLLVLLADGAGGTGSGAAVAELVVGAQWGESLESLDERAMRLGGQSTAVVIEVGAEVRGTSVGDSGAWLIGEHHVIELTAGQHRKPLVGDGCIPVAFEAMPLGSSTLVVASDGLFAYARRDDIARIARGADLEAAVVALVDLVRLANGSLQDDVAVVLCRAAADS